MILPMLGLLAILLWVARQAVGPLIGQETRGWLVLWCRRLVRRASRSLPEDQGGSFQEDWLAELAELEERPLSALVYAIGLARAARRISAEMGLARPPHGYPSLARLFDLSAAAAYLLLLAPAILAVAIAVKVDAPGPILARRRRLGLHGRPFEILTFRTHRGIEGDGLPPTRLPRPTRVGFLLTRLSLDQIPSLFNVLRGELALIGPPPQVPDLRGESLAVRPGVICWSTLREWGGADIDESEARRRDCARGACNDLRLMISLFLFTLRGGGPR